ACIFMVVKYVEYSHKFHDGLLPARHFEPAHEVWETPDFKKKHPESAAAAERIVAGLAARKNAQAAVSDEIVGAREGLALVPVANEGDTKVETTGAPTPGGEATRKQPAAASATGEKTAVTEKTAENQKSAGEAQATTPSSDATSAAEAVMPTTLAQEARTGEEVQAVESPQDGVVGESLADKVARQAPPEVILSDEAW